ARAPWMSRERSMKGLRMRSLRPLLLFSLVVGQAIAVGTSPAQAGRRGVEFPIPTICCGPRGITVGPDGNLWFTHWENKTERSTTAGEVTEYQVPTPFS